MPANCQAGCAYAGTTSRRGRISPCSSVVEQETHTFKIGGSIPLTATNMGRLAFVVNVARAWFPGNADVVQLHADPSDCGYLLVADPCDILGINWLES